MDNNNSSNHSDFTDVPKEFKKWNWGAFWLTWIWGISNGIYIALLALIPILNFIMPFYLGKKGGELVWNKNSWMGIEEVKLIQKKWAIAGWIFAIIMYTIAGFRIVDTYRIEKINASVTNKVMIELKKNEEVNNLLGDNYTFLFKPIIETISMTTGTFPVAQMIIIQGVNGQISVYTTLDEKYNIKEITVTDVITNKVINIDTVRNDSIK